MTDEEKKAINLLKSYENKLVYEISEKDKKAVKTILNLIEKQQKEIEELKENNGYHLGFIDGGIAKRYEYEEKIKAKIEEVKDGTYDAKIVLQSLLEEE